MKGGTQRLVEKWTWEKDEWVTTWEEIERWSIDPGRVPEPAWDSLEQCEEGYRRMEERRRYKGTRLARKPERQPQDYFLGRGHTRRLAESRRRPEPTPRAYCGERVTGQAPCYAVERTVSPVRYSSPVRSIRAPRICRAGMGIQPGRRVPAQHSWSPVYLLGPGYLVSGELAQPNIKEVSSLQRT
jgi:hypothetical protein